MSTTKTRRSLSLLAAFAVAAGALALPAATSATQAAPAFGLAATTERAPSLVDLDTAKTGSITIHKLVKDDTNGTTAGNGLEDTSDHGTPLDGAEFTVERLTTVDLTTQAGWEKLAGYRQGQGRRDDLGERRRHAAAGVDGTGTPGQDHRR